LANRHNPRRGAHLKPTLPHYRHLAIDIPGPPEPSGNCSRQSGPQFIIHTAAQPSHDKATSIPYDDFDVNALGTMNMAGGCPRFLQGLAFCFYQHQQSVRRPAHFLPLTELEKRYD